MPSKTQNNFLLIYPTMLNEAPMTLGMLAPILKEAGYKVSALVNTFRKPLEVEDFVEKAREVNAKIVGISMITFEVLKTHRIIKELKDDGFTIVVGGAHPTDCPEEMIEAGADIVVRNEGENTLRELCLYWKGERKLEDILGITYKKDGKIINNSPRPRMEITDLPMPDLSIYDIDLFRDSENFIRGFHRIYTSRGCPGTCTFCDWKVFGQVFKYYPTQEIIDEIKRRKEEYGLTSFSIADDCFTVVPERVFEFCEKIKPLKVEWRANSRANLITPEMCEAMKEAGCHSIAFGLESGDPETLRRIGKRVTLEENIKAPWMAHEAGLEVYGCLMTGFPWETEKNVENQIKFIREVWDAVSLFQVSGSLMPFPGTAIYRQYVEEMDFKEYWLKPEHQKHGIQIYQNYRNSYAISTFYQRYLFDDTYIQGEYFFKYAEEYKKKVREMVFEIGRHNLLFMFKDQKFRQKMFLQTARLSMLGHDWFPGLEMKIGGFLYDLFHHKGERSKIEQTRNKRRGIAKHR